MILAHNKALRGNRMPQRAALARSLMICRLCEKNAPLMKSHIIPEFLYSSMYDEKHRFHELSTNESKKNKFYQKGVTEKLLCGDCEQKLSKHERYASLFLNGGAQITYRLSGNFVIAEGLEYTSFKLFGLSILWRASVSSLDIFDQVILGSHEESLRKMMLHENPGKEYDFPFVMFPIICEGAVLQDLIMQPERTKVDGCNAYRFVFGGIVWVFIASSYRAPEAFISASISEAGALTMIPKRLEDMKFIVGMAQDLYRKGKVK